MRAHAVAHLRCAAACLQRRRLRHEEEARVTSLPSLLPPSSPSLLPSLLPSSFFLPSLLFLPFMAAAGGAAKSLWQVASFNILLICLKRWQKDDKKAMTWDMTRDRRWYTLSSSTFHMFIILHAGAYIQKKARWRRRGARRRDVAYRPRRNNEV